MENIEVILFIILYPISNSLGVYIDSATRAKSGMKPITEDIRGFHAIVSSLFYLGFIVYFINN